MIQVIIPIWHGTTGKLRNSLLSLVFPAIYIYEVITIDLDLAVGFWGAGGGFADDTNPHLVICD